MKQDTIESIYTRLLDSEEFSVPLSLSPNIIGPIDEAGVALLVKALFTHRPDISRVWLLHSNPRFRDQLDADCQLWNLPSKPFPEQLENIGEADQLNDPENTSKRMAIIQALATEAKAPEVIILSPESLQDKVPDIKHLAQHTLSLTIGSTLEILSFSKELEKFSYHQVPQVHERGQWAQRGGIIDVFPWQALHPVRLELFDTEIDSIREFDIHSQTTRRKLKKVGLLLSQPEANSTLSDYISKNDIIISHGETPHPRATLHFSTGPRIDDSGFEDFSTAIQPTPLPQFSAGDFVMQENQRQLFLDQIKNWHREDWSIFLFFSSEGEQSRFAELMGEQFCTDYGITTIHGKLNSGCCIPTAKITLLASAQLFGRKATNSRANTQLNHQRRVQAQTDLEDIQSGDLVVHNEYGIGRFKAISTTEEGSEEIQLRFRDGVILSVPIDQSHLISRYIGMGGKTPQLSKIGDGKWSKAKKHAEQAILDYAAQLLKIQAERHGRPGDPHPPDGKWMWEFESSFPYRVTLGQKEAIEDVKADMESHKPMDRLICGDVGFGKTEVAIRALFKAVVGGKQGALLVPTTVLAEQHWRTIQERMSHFPFRIELLNRFRKPAEVRETLRGLADGSVDLVIGTHRLVSNDVCFKNLGIVVIDEEQRFGVKHKEKFKQRFSLVDVLTLSATPIPRTLYLSLMGARDMSTIDTPPPNKVPVQTSICGYDDRIIRDSIKRELKRGGQVFFLHNRVQTIDSMREKLSDLVPEAKIVIGHGQMEKNQLEEVMSSFVNGEADILLSTTIIESGIDIPNANTIIIDRADRFGLADLYQLRGRVGRGAQQAYALLMIPRDLISGDAKRRMQAIQQYTALGSGFKIAMRDLEIRGAGSLLGTKQSGHISAVGFDLYCQLLKQSIDRLSGNAPMQRADVLLRVDFIYFNEGQGKQDALPCYLPAGYMPEARMRIQAYKRLAEATSQKELKKLSNEWKDRYGPLPDPAKNLIQTTLLKIAAAQANISIVEVKSQKLILTRNAQYIQLEGKRFPRLTETLPRKKLRQSIDMLLSI